jgi:N-acetylglucosaminyldiphosphoundecaprenol N-acetyl-beta-D-mannosaminyltransferase
MVEIEAEILSKTIRVCGIPVSTCPANEVLEDMDRNIHAPRQPELISITNSESIYYALRLESHRTYVERARHSLCDGIGVVIAGAAQGAAIHRLTGPALLEACCEYGVPRGWRHFFYGGRPGVPELLSEKLTARFPGMITAGTCSPPFRPLDAQEDAAVVETIRASRPDIVWVGLGLPKQEQWIAAHIGRVAAPWLIGVGAAFDFHAGTARWAPVWVRRAGCEWVYRLLHEPRMLRRDIRSLVFVGQALVDAFQRKRLERARTQCN